MVAKISRRDFLGLSLVTVLSACTFKSTSPGTPTVTVTRPTAIPDTTPRVYAPDDSNILYTGRIDFSDPKQPKFSAPGVTILARFRGTAAVVMLEDEFKWGTYRNYYDAVIDGTTVVKVAPEKSVTRYEVASGLPNTEHTLSLVKRTEAGIGSGKFLGFEFAGEMLPPPVRPARRIEFIGDSITCGSGIEAKVNSPQCTEDGWGQPYNNARLAYGPVLARNLNADYHVTAVSGIGLVRNYSFQYDARPLPEVYDLLYFEQTDSPAWDPSLFVPDVVVIALGTNDFSPGDSERPTMEVDVFVSTYVKFINKLRGYYPQADIFCASSPMLGDGWPTPGDKSATNQKIGITKVVDQFNQGGDAKVHSFSATSIVGMGCGTHPNVDQHARMADMLGSSIASVMGW
jgi:lysophospholipase L1-like esterase